MRRSFLSTLAVILALTLAGCAGMPGRDPLQVTVAGIDSLPGEGLEMRMLVKLRVQNPNDAPVDYDGIYLKLDVLGKTFATGVSDERGSVPRYGETVITVPVSVSALAAVRQAIGIATGDRTRVDYVLRGRLSGAGFGGMRFESKGEIDLPKGLAVPQGNG